MVHIRHPATKKRIPIYGPTEEECLAKAEKALEELLEVTRERIEAPENIPGTFSHFVFQTYCKHTYDGARATTIKKYDQLLRHHILPTLGHLFLDEVCHDDIQAMKDGLKRCDKREGELSPAQVREVLLRTREIFKLAIDLDVLDGKNPARLVKLPLKPKKKQRTDPERDFTANLLAKAAGTWLFGPIFSALFLGLRRGEVCGLKWDRIDRENNLITINNQRHPEYPGDSDPKGEDRVLPIPTELLAWIDKVGDKNSPYVFTQQDGKPLFPNEVTEQVPKLCVAAGLKRRTMHDLRSFAGSNLAALGVDPFTIMEILGHKELDTTLIYVNAKQESKRQAVAKLLQAHLGETTARPSTASNLTTDELLSKSAS